MSLLGLGIGLAGGFLGGGPSTRNLERAQQAMYDDRNRALKVYNNPRNSADWIQSELERLYSEKMQKNAMTALSNFAAGDRTREFSDTNRDRIEGSIAYDSAREMADALAPFLMNRGIMEQQRVGMTRIDPNAANVASQVDAAKSGGDPLSSIMDIAGALTQGGTETDSVENIAEEAEANSGGNNNRGINSGISYNEAVARRRPSNFSQRRGGSQKDAKTNKAVNSIIGSWF